MDDRFDAEDQAELGVHFPFVVFHPVLDTCTFFLAVGENFAVKVCVQSAAQERLRSVWNAGPPKKRTVDTFNQETTMPTEYCVLTADQLFTVPSIWQNPFTRAKTYAAALEQGLNAMSAEGWELVESHHDRWLVFIFQRAVSESGEEETGIRSLTLSQQTFEPRRRDER